VKLLVTNDDGIDSVFLHELVRALHAAGHELFVTAPRREQSWIGAAKSRGRAVHSGAEDRGLGCPTWVVDGTPSDCVNIALGHLLPCRPDAVLSGINMGMNASLAFIIASGTIAGAWEGALHGLPAVALSQDLTPEAYDRLAASHGKIEPDVLATLRVSVAHAARFAPELAASSRPGSFVVHNVNYPFPCPSDAPVRRTVPARVVIPGLFSPQADDGTHRLVFKLGEDVSPPEPLTDRTAIATGCISHSVLDYTRIGA